MSASGSTKQILIAPLDWGLGHATRSIPVIRTCIEAGCSVVIASSGRSLALLKNEFPDIRCIDLPSYNIYYQKKGSFVFTIIRQLGKVFSAIRREHRAVKKIISEHNIGLIISDNRYGVYYENIYSIIITHQLMVKLPGLKLIEKIVFLWLQWQHRKFNEVWIPDVAGKINISGDLSHKYKIGKQIKFIGVLTRFQKPSALPPKQYDVIVILSGPEPQRSIFEELIISQAQKTNLKYLIVQGISEVKSDENKTPDIRVVSHLTGNDLFQAVLVSDIVISRGGYSTLMDLAPIGKRCIFVPTPGQTEQEYLVKELAGKQMVYYAEQEKFNLFEALEGVKKINPFFIDVNCNEYKSYVLEAINKLK